MEKFFEESALFASGNTEAEHALMSRICERWRRGILQATRNSSVSPCFLAALTANESGGEPAAQAFEPGIYRRLQAVASGREPAFGTIVAKDLIAAADSGFGPLAASSPGCFPDEIDVSKLEETAQEQLLRKLATSWGLTQIMGYQVIGRQVTLEDLLEPESHYQFAVLLLEELGRRFGLKLSRDYESLFRSWNTGHPEGKTFDPDYVSRGMLRMELYRDVVQGYARADSGALT